MHRGICKPFRELYACVEELVRKDPIEWLEYDAFANGSEANWPVEMICFDRDRIIE